jgi:nucleoside-diphosphate-sugar epimerase
LKVIVTGASGFTGRAVVNELESHGWDVIPIVRRPSGLRNEYLIDPDKVDVFSRLSLLPRSDAIIHLASHVDLSKDARADDFFVTNLFYTSCLTQLAKLWSAQLVFSSSIIVYGDVEYIDSNTTTESEPVNEYAHAKLFAENIIKSASINYTILRISGIYGYKGPRHLGLNNAITYSIDDSHIPILKGFGSAKRNYIYVYDLAYSIRVCLEQKIHGTHLVAGDEVITIKKMLEAVCEVLLNDEQLIQEIGCNSKDTVVKQSSDLPKGRSLYNALLDIRDKYITK